jgi:hypothetical protein
MKRMGGTTMENDQYIAFMERQYAILSEKDKFVPLDEIE